MCQVMLKLFTERMESNYASYQHSEWNWNDMAISRVEIFFTYFFQIQRKSKVLKWLLVQLIKYQNIMINPRFESMFFSGLTNGSGWYIFYPKQRRTLIVHLNI